MRNFRHSLLADMELEKRQLVQCRKELRMLPGGGLKSSGKGGERLYFRSQDGKEQYIRTDSKLSAGVSRRRFLEKRVKILESNLKAQGKLLEKYISYTDENIMNFLAGVYREQMEVWLQRKRAAVLSDDGMEGYGGRPRHKTPDGEGRDSKGEVILSMAFDAFGIPYAYGQPLFWQHGRSAAADRARETYGLPEVIVPDFIFTMPDGRKIYWEHLGKLDDEKYVLRWMKKLQFYYWMGITQGVDLIVTADDSNGTIDMEAISEIIESKLAPLIVNPRKHR